MVGGKTYITPIFSIPGIVTGAAYADLDAMGVAFSIAVPYSGVIQTAIYYDLDDEGLQLDLWLLDSQPAIQTDNSALAFTDSDLQKVIPGSPLRFTTFADAANGQTSSLSNIGAGYCNPTRRLWIQAQARGALNIAASSEPRFRFVILADE